LTAGGCKATLRAGGEISLANLLRATSVHVAFAFLAMGGWTLFANRAHGFQWMSAATQGVASAVITLVLKRVLEALGGRFPGRFAFVFPPLLTASAILVVLTVLHHLIGTPAILQTIAVPWSVSTLYAILYAADVERRR
jgi:hypothetical protein